MTLSDTDLTVRCNTDRATTSFSESETETSMAAMPQVATEEVLILLNDPDFI